MNTKLEYLYRDGSNYKQHGSVVLTGLPEGGLAAFAAALKATLDDGSNFIADQVGLPEQFLWAERYKLDDDDHCWHEYFGVEAVPDEPDDERTPAQLLAAFQAAQAAGWKEFDPSSR